LPTAPIVRISWVVSQRATQTVSSPSRTRSTTFSLIAWLSASMCFCAERTSVFCCAAATPITNACGPSA